MPDQPRREVPGYRASRARDSLAFSYLLLESRALLAATIGYDAGTQVVTVQGDSGNDWALLEVVAGGMVRLTAGGASAWQQAQSLVSRIDFIGGSGNDSFTNSTSVASQAWGHGGDDVLAGGSGGDLLYGGTGVDQLTGNDGNDTLSGGDGADTLQGGAANDTLDGGNGNDVLSGGDGNDSLYSGWDHDWLYGEAGDDWLYGFSGDDRLWGGTGLDSAYGQAGNDLVYGGDGNDRVRGNNGNDQVFGDAGDDWLMGDDGDDRLEGGSGADLLWAWLGADTLLGGDDNDGLYGQDDNDQLEGGAGHDVLSGGNGFDSLNGDAGSDSLYGDFGNDELRGGAGVDVLRGGAGNDSLFGGESSTADTLYGDEGRDRLLTEAGDTAVDVAAEDAEVQFRNRTDSWTAEEIEVMDDGFERLVGATNSTRLLRDTLTTTPLQFFKYADLNGAAGINWLQSSSSSQWINGQWQTTWTYLREIRIAEWDESDAWMNDQFASVCAHEIGHNWDGELELQTLSAAAGQLWNSFLALSGWQESNPGGGTHQQSLDGEWWYLQNAAFHDSYGRTNPFEDFATTWELFFDPNASAGNQQLMAAKLAVLDQLMALLG